MSAILPEIREAHEVLARTPALLNGWLRGLSEPWLSATEGEGTYSPRDVIAHLVDNEEVDWIPRLRIILEHGEAKAFEPFDRDAFRVKFAALSVDALLDAFTAHRKVSLATLLALELSRDDLARTGTHPALGRVTAGQLIATWVTHDLTHVAQIARVMAKRYGAAVGPWHAYIGVLSDRAR
jgi:hypothetical protein